MTDTIRDLLISLASHMAYMQGQLEALHELSDPEDYYWYRESVLLRQKVTDALADEPAAGERASVVGEPTQRQLMMLADEMNLPSVGDAANYARAVLACWGNPAPQPPSEGEPSDEELLRTAAFAIEPHDIRWSTPEPPLPADKEAAESVEWLMITAGGEGSFGRVRSTRAANLLQQQVLVPVSVSERLPGPKDCDAEGRCWWWYPEVPGKTYGYWAHEDDAVPERAFNEQPLHWLPAHALPIPQQQENHQ